MRPEMRLLSRLNAQNRGFSSVVERLLDKQDVTGSSPVTPIAKPLDWVLGALLCLGFTLRFRLERLAQ